MNPVHVVIADDELLARRRIKKLLERDGDIAIVAEARNGREAVAAIRNHRPELVFLDIQMPVMNGFDVIRETGDVHVPFIVFVTAYDKYALRAFKVHALDYLLKPFDDDEFRDALNHAKEALRRHRMHSYAERMADLLRKSSGNDHGGGGGRKFMTRFVIKNRDRIFFVPVGSVDWIEASGKYAVLHVGQRSQIIRETMVGLMEKLDPSQFVRIHRSAIVNISRIKELQPWSRGEYRVILENGVRLTSGRSGRELVDAIGMSREW